MQRFQSTNKNTEYVETMLDWMDINTESVLLKWKSLMVFLNIKFYKKFSPLRTVVKVNS